MIRQTTDRLQGETPIHLVQAARPILILDEPQNMESEKSVAALAALDPLGSAAFCDRGPISSPAPTPATRVYSTTPLSRSSDTS